MAQNSPGRKNRIIGTVRVGAGTRPFSQPLAALVAISCANTRSAEPKGVPYFSDWTSTVVNCLIDSIPFGC